MRRSLIARAILITGFAIIDAAVAAPPPTHWRTLKTEAYPKKRDDIIFLSRDIGFYGTGMGDLFRTDDGGLTWTRVLHSPGTFIRALNFIDSERGFIGNLGPGFGGDIADANPLYRTGDGGRTWTPVDLGAAIIPGI